MFTTLQKEYALIYYIHHVLGQTNNNGFLHELYTEKNTKTIIEALIQNKIKDQQTINIEKVVDRVMPQVDIEALTNPRKENAKFNILPYSPVSFMELYMGNTINKALLDMKQRVFIDDITDAKDGLAAYFVSIFRSSEMASDKFINLVTLEKHPSIDEIEHAIHTKYPNSVMFANTKDMSEVEAVIEPYARQISKNHFTNKDLSSLFIFIQANYGNKLSKLSLENGINAVIKQKETNADEFSFDDQRDIHESDVKGKVQSSPRIGNYFANASHTRFMGTMKYTKNGTLDNNSVSNVIQLALRKQDRTHNGTNIDMYTQFVSVLNNLLSIESLPPVQSGTYGDIRTVILTEEQYHALFPEYFVTVGILKEKVTSATDMGNTTMKSGDEASSIIDNYTGENKYEEDEDDSFDSNVITVGKNKKLMLAKMLATINEHPNSVPDQIEPTKIPNSAIYEMNRILVREIFNSSYKTLEGLVDFLTNGNLPIDLQKHEPELLKLKTTYLDEHNNMRQEAKERETHIKAFATVLSELSRIAQIDPQSLYKKNEAKSFYRNVNMPNTNNITITSGGNTYILNNLPIIVNTMVEHAKEGEFIASMTLSSNDPSTSALNFLHSSGLLMETNGVYRINSDTEHIKERINQLDWVALPTIHQRMMSTALRNCSYIYKHNGWVPMSNAELKANKFTPIKDDTKIKESSDDTAKLVSLIERIQGKIKKDVVIINAINDIINIIRKDYHIDGLNLVEVPVVNNDTMSVADGMMQMLGTDNSAESIDNLAQGYYINHILAKYKSVSETACKHIRKTLAENGLLNEQTRRRLTGNVHHEGRKTSIINTIFDGVKPTVHGNIAENSTHIETSDIFTISQAIINLYNKVLNDLVINNPTIANMFTHLDYIKVDDVKSMAQGNCPSQKMYTEGENICANEFLLNAYLINVLFEAIYLINVNFNIPAQNKYTTQDVKDMRDINQMKTYIKDNINITVLNNMNYRQLITTINQRLNMLFMTPMLNMVVAVIANNPQIKQLTVGAHNMIHGKTSHMSSEKVINNVNKNLENKFTQSNADIAKKKREDYLNKYWID
jgi:hypothetical protein